MQDLGSTQHFSVQVEPETGVKVVYHPYLKPSMRRVITRSTRSWVTLCRVILPI